MGSRRNANRWARAHPALSTAISATAGGLAWFLGAIVLGATILDALAGGVVFGLVFLGVAQMRGKRQNRQA